MPVRGDKHGEAAKRVFYPGFDGGLNLAAPSESIALNELKEAVNVEFSPKKGVMKSRGGLVWSGHFDFDVADAIRVPGTRGFLVREKGSKRLDFFRWNCIWPVRGELSGDGPMSCAAWGDDASVVASGGKLQKFRPWGDSGLPEITDISGAPDKCRAVFVRDGRVGVAAKNTDDDHFDTLRFSAVGDCESWENDVEDESSGQFLEVGYKDGMDIDAVVPLSKDLIIFKSPKGEPDKGIVHRLTGSFPDWLLLEAAHNTGTFSQGSVQPVGNDVFYLTTAGLASLSTVTAYGEVRTAWPDRKVANALAQRLRDTALLWNVAVKEQLWILPGDGNKTIWAFDCGRGIWTQLEFPEPPVFAAGVRTELYAVIGADIYHVHDGYAADELYRKTPVPVNARMKTGAILNGLQTLIKGAFVSFSAPPETEAELKLKGFEMPLRVGGTGLGDIAGEPNTEICAFTDGRYLFGSAGVATARRHCIVRGWDVVPEIEIRGGGLGIHTMGLETVEV